MSARRRSSAAGFLRVLPHASPMRRMWAGSKFLALAASTVVTVAAPGWGGVVALALVVPVAGIAARVPRAVIPRPPLLLVLLLLIGGVTAAVGGGLDLFAQSVLIGLGVLALGLVVTWSTPADELGAVVATLLRPLGRLGLPTGIWAATAALAVRSLPLVVDDLQTILAVRRLRRPATAPPMRAVHRAWAAIREAGDLAVTAVVVSARRGADVAAAVAARGGVRPLRAERPALGLPDLGCAVAAVGVVTVTLLWP